MTQRLSILAILLLFSVVAQATPLNPCAPFSSPSRKNSEVTDRKNVWGGKFLDEYSSFDFSESPMTVGIEVEFTVPNLKNKVPSRKRIELAKIVKRKIKDELHGAKVVRKRNKIFYEINGERYQYDLVHDSTIVLPFNHIDVELRSPILRNKADVDLFYKVLEELKTREEIMAGTLTESIHVHVGVPNIRASELAMIVSLFAAIEKQISEVFPTHIDREHYAGHTNRDLLSFLETADINDIQFDKMKEFVPTRNYKLNILSLADYKTLEFRLFNGTVDYREIQQMVNFATEFIRAVREKDPRLIEFLSRHHDKKDLPFKELAEALELNLP